MSETENNQGMFKAVAIWFGYLKSTLLILSFGAIILLLFVLAKTENQRNALFKYECEDPLFKSHDIKCLNNIETREHWWQHVYAAFKN